MIDKPGLYEITAAEYHADPTPAPSLSSSIAKELLSTSPRHAWYAHPRLNAQHEDEHDEKFDRGTAAHAYLLQGETGFELIDAPDFKTNAAKKARDLARLAGKLPLLKHRWDEVVAMAEAARYQLDHHEDRPRPLSGGKAEQTLVWQEGEIWCRARLDWLHDDHRVIDDLKTSAAAAEPDSWIRRQLFGMGYDIQAAFYLRGLKAVTGIDAAFRFVVLENFAPYGLCVVGLGPEALDLAERKVETAITRWRECLETGTWPGYPTHTCWADLPPWEATRWAERGVTAGRAPSSLSAVDDGRDLATQLFGDQA